MSQSISINRENKQSNAKGTATDSVISSPMTQPQPPLGSRLSSLVCCQSASSAFSPIVPAASNPFFIYILQTIP